MMRRYSLSTMLIALLLAAVRLNGQTPSTVAEPVYEPGQLLIQVNPVANARSVADAFPGVNLRAVELLSPDWNIWLYEYEPAGMLKSDHERLLDAVRINGGVLLAQFNHRVTQRATPNDTRFSEQWALNNTGQSGGTVDADIDAPEAWDIATGGVTANGDTIVVAIIDGGFQLTHPDIPFFKNKNEIPSNGIDDDLNGYIDDYDGWDAYASDGTIPSDNHGTHVAGIAAAIGNNAQGVSGVNWGAKVMPIAGSSSNEATVVRAYTYVFKMRRLYNQTNGVQGAFVVSTNSSFGVDYGQPANFPLWCAMYDSLGSVGILSACATANLGINIDTQGDIPTACPSPWMVSVTNTTSTDARNSGAAYGLTTIDLGAPGTSILSTLPTSTYGNLTGTSMATPHVCGAVALMWAAACPTMLAAYDADPGTIALTMKQYLLNGTDPKPALAGQTVSGGRLNIFNSLNLVLSYPCGVSIQHIPLTDTKNSTNPYPVVASITADAPLYSDSLFLDYTIGASNYRSLLTATANPNEYAANIPAQAPGTIISYRLEAHATNGKADTTETFVFRIIDYAVLLSPALSTGTGGVDDTVWHSFSVTNDGVFNDDFALSLSGVDWTTEIWNNAQTAQISATGSLTPNQSFNFKVAVIVPPSLFGARDTAFVKATSAGSALIFKTSLAQTTSAGQPLDLPFVDNFPSTTINVGLWQLIKGVTVDDVGINEPSAPYSLRLNGSPTAGDTLASQTIDLSDPIGALLTYSFQKTGGGDAPETGDDLIVEYYNNAGNWLQISRQLGSMGSMTTFATVTMAIPADGLHAAFRLRFRSIATVGNSDDWFVDDVIIDRGPAMSTTPISINQSLPENDSTTTEMVVENAGPGTLNYSMSVQPVLSRAQQLFAELQAQGHTHPASYTVPADQLPLYDQPKGSDNSVPRGPEVIYGAGGPDAFGYIWLDSNEPGGPNFNWIDISATGTDVIGGMNDDNFVGPFPIGFAFPFYDGNYTQFYISANGYIGFGPPTDFNSFNNQVVPTAATPNNAIFWCWDDLNPDDADNTTGKALYQNVGSDLVVSFVNYPEYDGSVNPGDVISAQIILSPDGTVKIQYLSFGAGFVTNECTIGTENATGTDGLQIAFNAPYIAANLAVEITKPTQWLFVDSSPTGVVPPAEADTITLKFVSAGLDTGVYNANLKVFSNDPAPGHNPLVLPAKLTVTPPPPPYLCGDADGSDAVSIADAVYLINYIFNGGPAPIPEAAADANCDAAVSIADGVYIITYIFESGPAPCSACP